MRTQPPTMRIIAYCYSDERSASVRYRILAPLSQLRHNGDARVMIVYPGYSPIRLYRFFIAAVYSIFLMQSQDVLLIHKVCSSGLYQGLLRFISRWTRAKIIYDIDDAEWHRQNTKGMTELLPLVDQIHAGSTTLLKHFQTRGYTTYHLTSCVNPPTCIGQKESNTLHIGWIGGYNSHTDPLPFAHKRALFAYLIPALRAYPSQIQLTLLGVERDQDKQELLDLQKTTLSNVHVNIPHIEDWSNEAKIDRLIAQWDLGIALMVDHPFNHGKSAFKAKQCMNCGVPVIGNAIGDNDHYIVHHKTGYLATNAKEVLDALAHYGQLSINDRMAMRDHCLEQASDFQMDQYIASFLTALGQPTLSMDKPTDPICSPL